MSDLNDLNLRARVDEYQRKRNRAPWVAMALALALLIGGGWYVQYDSDRGANRFQTTTQRLDALETNYAALYEKFERCKGKDVEKAPACASPGVPPVDEVTGKTTIVQPVERLSTFEIRNAVATYCAATGVCDGQDPSKSQVLAAVSKYCDANGSCTPPPPKDGVDGAPGVAGAEGPRGPGPTDEQVVAAVVDYCSKNSCVGPKGDEVVSVKCFGGLTPLRFAFTFASGRTDTIECENGLGGE